jgi:hypothetical protein
MTSVTPASIAYIATQVHPNPILISPLTSSIGPVRLELIFRLLAEWSNDRFRALLFEHHGLPSPPRREGRGGCAHSLVESVCSPPPCLISLTYFTLVEYFRATPLQNGFQASIAPWLTSEKGGRPKKGRLPLTNSAGNLLSVFILYLVMYYQSRTAVFKVRHVSYYCLWKFLLHIHFILFSKRVHFYFPMERKRRDFFSCSRWIECEWNALFHAMIS